MGSIIIQDFTTKTPITMIGMQAGVCCGADITDDKKNYKRGLDCLESGHGRTFEYPDIYTVIDGYSARTIREWYTHIGGSPTRLQASTRYIDYTKRDGFDYVIPKTLGNNPLAVVRYKQLMKRINDDIIWFMKIGVSKEDAAMCLPLGMSTKIVDKRNLRNVIDMSRQRMCNRAYWEYRELFNDYSNALRNYSSQWRYLVDNYFMPKCDVYGYCTEEKSCGRKERRNG